MSNKKNKKEKIIENCPKCDNEYIRCDSSREMKISEIKCSDCGYKIQKSVPEERIIEIWNECKEKVNKVLKRYKK